MGSTMEQLVKYAGKFKNGVGLIKDLDENLQNGEKIFSETYQDTYQRYGDPELARRTAERARKAVIGGSGLMDGANLITVGRIPMGTEGEAAWDKIRGIWKDKLGEDAKRSSIMQAGITDDEMRRDRISGKTYPVD